MWSRIRSRRSPRVIYQHSKTYGAKTPTYSHERAHRQTHTHEFKAICQHDTTTRVMTTDLNVSKDHILPEELCGYSVHECVRVCSTLVPTSLSV